MIDMVYKMMKRVRGFFMFPYSNHQLYVDHMEHHDKRDRQ